MTPASIIRACCPAGADLGRGYISGGESDAPGYGYTGRPGPEIATIRHEPSERVAWHEAAHAVVGFLFGWPIASVSIKPPECVRFDVTNREPWARMVGALAGGAGEDARAGWLYYEPSESIEDFVARAHALCGGGCDGCRAALAAWQIVGISASQDAAADQWRAAEFEARRICNQPKVRTAIEQLADRLMASPSMEGDAVHALLAKNLTFGELADGGQNND